MDEEELLDFALEVTYTVGLELPVSLHVTAPDVALTLWLDVPDPAGERVGGLLLTVPL